MIFEPVFERAYFATDFATIRRNKFPARYFWYKAKLKQKKFILKSRALCFYASILLDSFELQEMVSIVSQNMEPLSRGVFESLFL